MREPPDKARRRGAIVAALGAVIALGLASRKFGDALPEFVAANAGDALWTVAVYLALAFVLPKSAPLRLGLAAYGISVAVELSQLVDVGWLSALRQTLPGKLLLGAGFVWADLARYLAGAVLATAVDILRATRRGRNAH